MTPEDHHQAALIETARLELTRAHRAVLALDAAEIRHGMQIALNALREAAGTGQNSVEPSVLPRDKLVRLAESLEHALIDLQDGALAELGALVEATRKELDA